MSQVLSKFDQIHAIPALEFLSCWCNRVLIQRCGFMRELQHVWAVGNKSSHVFGRGITRAHLEFTCPDPLRGKKPPKKHVQVIIKVLHSYWKWSACVGRQHWKPDNSGFVSNTSFIGSYRVSELDNPHSDSSSPLCGRRDGIPEEDRTHFLLHPFRWGGRLTCLADLRFVHALTTRFSVHLSRKNR